MSNGIAQKTNNGVLWRYGFAGACIGLPLLLYVLMDLTLYVLATDYKIPAILDCYTLRDEVEVSLPRLPHCSVPQKPAAPTTTVSVSNSASNVAKKVEPDPKVLLWAQYIGGRYNIVVTTGFISLVAILAITFGAATIYRSANLATLGWMVTAACLFAAAAAYALYKYQLARFLVVDGILNKADLRAVVPPIMPTSEIINLIIFITNFVGYVGSGLVLGALCTLSVRARPGQLNVDKLRWRRNQIRLALVLASAILAVSVISTKILLQWPLSLLIDSQSDALRVLADAILLRWGSLGTIALAAAFIPAIVSWYLDVEVFRGRSSAKPRHSKEPAATAKDDGLDIELMPAVASAVAVLAPLLASPFADTLKALLGVLK